MLQRRRRGERVGWRGVYINGELFIIGTKERERKRIQKVREKIPAIRCGGDVIRSVCVLSKPRDSELFNVFTVKIIMARVHGVMKRSYC